MPVLLLYTHTGHIPKSREKHVPSQEPLQEEDNRMVCGGLAVWGAGGLVNV